MPASPAFNRAWRQTGRKEFTLVKFVFANPARTLYLATAEVTLPGSPPQTYEDVVQSVEVRSPGSFGTTRFERCTATVKLIRRKLAHQAVGLDALHSFTDLKWQGALVTISAWESSLSEGPFNVFSGVVSNYSVRDGVSTISCEQRSDFNPEIPAEVAGPDKYPRIPDRSRGAIPAICYGALTGVPLRTPPWTSEYGNIATGQHGMEHIMGGRRGVPGIIVDIGRGGDAGGQSKVLFASHPCRAFGDITKGTSLWMEQDGKLCNVEAGVQVNNCRCASGVAQITRPSGNFLTDGVQPNALVLNTISQSFPAGTRITTVGTTTLGTTNPANATVSVDTPGEFLNLFNDSVDGTGMLIGDTPSGGVDPTTTVYIPLLPSNVELVAANNAENPRAVLDPFNDTSYARLDYTAGFRELRVRFQNVPEQGTLLSADLEIGVELVSGTIGGNVKMAFEQNRGGGNFSENTLPTPSPNPGFVGLSMGATPAWGVGGLPTNPWEFGQCIARIYFSASQNAILRIYAIGLTLRVRPTKEIVAQRVALVPVRVEKQERGFLGKWTPYRYSTTELQEGTVPVYGPLIGQFSANMEGWADDGSGTYTGVNGALIERSPDIVHHLLRTYGNQQASQVELGANEFGSLVAARAALKTWRQGDMKHAFALVERVGLQRLIETIGNDSMCWFHLDPFTDKFHCIPWRTGMPVSYATKIPRAWISQERIDFDNAPASEIVSSVVVPYSIDHVTKSPLFEVSIGPKRSNAGHRYRGIRDQQLTVIASGPGQNNKFDFTSNATYTVTLDAGDYEPMDFAVHLATKMTAADGGNHPVSYGPEVVAGHNDTIRFYDGTSNQTATIAPGAYETFEALAAAIVTAINAVMASPQNAICTYDRATRKLTIGRASGTFSLLWNSGNVTMKRARVMVGASTAADQTGASSYVMAFEREEQRFAIGDFTPFAILWETGANGLNAAAGMKNCAALAGFDASRDSVGAESYLGHSPKGAREIACAAAALRYGAREPLRFPGTTIQETDTAREIAMRAIDLYGVPHARIRFASTMLLDLERGRVIEFESDVDALGPYPREGSDGSWAGKRFVVTETRQTLGPDTYETEVVAVEV